MALRQLSDGGPDGTKLGQSATDLIGFYGVTVTAQRAVLTAVATTGAAPTAFGFTTTAQFLGLISAVNELVAMAKAQGFMATA